MHLTEKSVHALLATGKRAEYCDTVLRGLVLRVMGSGSRTYGLRYRFAGQPRRLHIGDAGLISLADARQQARELLADAIKGSDPVEVTSERRAAEEARRKSERTIRQLALARVEGVEGVAAADAAGVRAHHEPRHRPGARRARRQPGPAG